MKISYTCIIFIVSLVNGQRWMQAYSEVNPELKPLLDSLFQTFGWRYDALKEKWSMTTSKWYKRYEEMTQNCRFDGRSFELPTSNRSDVCQVNFKQSMIYKNKTFLKAITDAADALKTWGAYHTMDCTKTHRQTDDKWFKRNEVQLENLKNRSLRRMIYRQKKKCSAEFQYLLTLDPPSTLYG